MRRNSWTVVRLACASALGLALLSGSATAANIATRRDIKELPAPLKARIVELSKRPHSEPPLPVFAEADSPSQLFAYFLLGTKNFEPNVFTTTIPGINDGMAPTATGANHDRPTIGSVRLVLEPKPGLPTDPHDPGAFIDIFTDLSGLFVINNESGWYEGWMLWDLRVPPTAEPRDDGHAQFGTMTEADATAIAAIGDHLDLPGRLFTTDGKPIRLPQSNDHFPDVQTNLVPLQLSMGAYNALQQADAHSYWEFNQYTDWVAPPYELPVTGGLPGTFEAGQIGAFSSVVPGSGPAGVSNDPVAFGDDPFNPRDPDRLQASSLEDADRPMPPNEEHAESRLRFIPSGLAAEILRDAYIRIASFEPYEHDLKQRLFDAYAAEVARVDENGDGVTELDEVDLEEESDGQSNERLFLSAPAFDRFAVTREINDGLLSPRFAPSQRAWVSTGRLVAVSPSVDASVPRDDDNR